MTENKPRRDALLKPAVVLTSAACWWLTFTFAFGLGEPSGLDEGIAKLVRALTALSWAIPSALSYLVYRRYTRRSTLPTNILDVPLPARTLVTHAGIHGAWLVPMLWGAVAGSALLPLVIRPEATMIGVGMAAMMTVIALGIAREERKERVAAEEFTRRIEQVRGAGTRVIAEVTEVTFESEWRHQNPQFTVTARFATPTGVQTATSELFTDPGDAPVVGGTVLIWYIADGTQPSETYMEQDVNSIREPGAAARYAAPSGN